MKTVFIPLVLLAMASAVVANVAPTVVIQSAAMRPGTTLMDVVYRVNDPDDATVKIRALAFVDGVRSFAKVLKPVTFVEGTAAKLGDAIPSNTNHTLTWDVAADWNVDLGQIKFEVLAMDGRGLLPFDWITIPAAGGKPVLTISKDSPTNADVLNGFFWQYADGDSWLTLTSGVLGGNAGSGVYADAVLVNEDVLQGYSAAYILKRMNLDPADSGDVAYAAINARAGLLDTTKWHAINRPYMGIDRVVAWGSNSYGQTPIPAGLNGVTAIAAGRLYSVALKSDGTVLAWTNDSFGGQTTIPVGLNGVTAISAGGGHILARRIDGTVVGWGGSNSNGETTIPAGLSGVNAIAAGGAHSLALMNNGTVVGWGYNYDGEITIPPGLNGVTAIAAGYYHSLALKSDGTVVGWGGGGYGENRIPAGLNGVSAIAAGRGYSLALKSNGSVVGWGLNGNGQITIPAGLTGVIAIAAGEKHSIALKSDGTVVAWGDNSDGQTTIPAGLTGVSAIAAGYAHNLARKAKAP